MDGFAGYLLESGIMYSENAPLAVHSTFGIGGNADYIVMPTNRNELCGVIGAAEVFGVRYGVFGNASNTLFSDNGFRGVVILTKKMRSYSVDGCFIDADCGISQPALSRIAAKAGLSGLEFMCSIPGTLGGAVYMNAGAHGGDMSSVVVSCECYRRGVGLVTVTEHCFSYRRSVYMTSGDVILGCRMKLVNDGCDVITERMNSYIAYRREHQPITAKSAGSFFKRGDGFITAKLIDECGLKGIRVGGAQVSPSHAGFIVNTGNATAADVLGLSELIKKRVYEKFGVDIESEVQIIE